MCGLVVTQYSPETGSIYSILTYLVLVFQVFLGAVSGVINQRLLKDCNAGIHECNTVLYATGVVVNLLIHFAMRVFMAGEPSFFAGYDDLLAVLIIINMILLGLVMSAVLKC